MIPILFLLLILSLIYNDMIHAQCSFSPHSNTNPLSRTVFTLYSIISKGWHSIAAKTQHKITKWDGQRENTGKRRQETFQTDGQSEGYGWTNMHKLQLNEVKDYRTCNSTDVHGLRWERVNGRCFSVNSYSACKIVCWEKQVNKSAFTSSGGSWNICASTNYWWKL